MPDWLKERISYCHDPNDWCHVGDWTNFTAAGYVSAPDENYGLPHVLEVGATRCLYCGATCAS